MTSETTRMKNPTLKRALMADLLQTVGILPILILIGMAPKSTVLLFTVVAIMAVYFILLLGITLRLGTPKGRLASKG